MDEVRKQAEIRSAVAFKAAVDIVTADPGFGTLDIVDAVADLSLKFYSILEDLAGGPMAVAEANVQRALDARAEAPSRATSGPAARQNQARRQAPTYGNRSVASTTGIPAKWQALFDSWNGSEFVGWYDNRGNKLSDASPDFKNKTTDEGLWLDGKFGRAPEAVFQALDELPF